MVVKSTHTHTHQGVHKLRNTSIYPFNYVKIISNKVQNTKNQYKTVQFLMVQIRIKMEIR